MVSKTNVDGNTKHNGVSTEKVRIQNFHVRHSKILVDLWVIKYTIEQATKTQKRSRGIALLFLLPRR